MMNGFIFIGVFLAGVVVSLQSAVNGELGKRVGVVEASWFSVVVGALLLSVILVLTGKVTMSQVLQVPKWQFAGGLLGSFYILVMVIAVPRIGISASVIMVVAGQLACSTVIDHWGFIHQAMPIHWKKVVALVMMMVAVVLFYKE